MDENSETAVRVTADTNVFYYLGAGKLRKDQLISSGEELWATPINILEIVAGLNPKEWNVRRAAAAAIVQFSDHMAADPEEHLEALIECRTPQSGTIWLEGAKALSQATSEDELLRGVADYVARVVRSVRPSVAEAAKGKHYEGFRNNILEVCDEYLPGYRAAVDAGTQAPVVDKRNRDKLRTFLLSPELRAAMFSDGLAQRSGLFGSRKLDLTSDDTRLALRDLAPYCAIYGAYLWELLTARRKPDANDWGDLELFIYLQPGTFVATTEKKWWGMADRVGLGGDVRKISPTG